MTISGITGRRRIESSPGNAYIVLSYKPGAPVTNKTTTILSGNNVFDPLNMPVSLNYTTSEWLAPRKLTPKVAEASTIATDEINALVTNLLLNLDADDTSPVGSDWMSLPTRTNRVAYFESNNPERFPEVMSGSIWEKRG